MAITETRQSAAGMSLATELFASAPRHSGFSWLDREKVHEQLRLARVRDAFGHQVHTALGMLYFLALPLATAPKEFAYWTLFLWWLVRLRHTWRTYAVVFRAPMVLALLAFSMWHLASFLWSTDVGEAWDNFRAQRVLLLPLFVWPVLDRAPWLIGSLLLGVLAQNGAQALEALGLIDLRDDKHRIAGAVHPIKTGAFCVAAMCWHATAFAVGRGRLKWGSLALFAVAAAGLVATESRGPWIAAAVTMPLLVICIAMRHPPARKPLAVLTIGTIILLIAGWPIYGPRAVTRIRDAMHEVERAREKQVYWSSVGLRVGMTEWSWSIFTNHLAFGAGAGDYQLAQAEDAKFQAALASAPDKNKKVYIERSHPHSMYLYTLACLGAVGGVMLVLFMIFSLRQAWRDPPDHVYAYGSFFALLTWFIGTSSDCYNLDGQRLGLLALILAVTLPGRLPVRLRLSAVDDRQRLPDGAEFRSR